jgi:hypothetical protein
MQKFILMILCGAAFLSLFTANGFAQRETIKVSKKEYKRLQNVGYLSVTTNPEAYPVFINGKDYGLAGNPNPNQIELPVGTYDVEIRFPEKPIVKRVTIDPQKRVCMCYSMVKKRTTRPCPYDVTVDAPTAVIDGDIITFSADPHVSGPPINLIYRWSVSPETVQIRDGQGTPTISIDSTNLGSQRIVATLDVDTGDADINCRQRIPITVDVKPITKKEKQLYDNFDFKNNDALKQRLDNLTIALQAQPDMQAYLIVYARRGGTAKEADRLGIRALDYLTRVKKVDARRVTVVNGGFRQSAGFEIYLLPPGVDPPMPRPQ